MDRPKVGETPHNRENRFDEVKTLSQLVDRICTKFKAFKMDPERRGGETYIKKGTEWKIPVDATRMNDDLGEDFQIGLHWSGGWVAIPYKVFLKYEGSPVELGKKMLEEQESARAEESARQEKIQELAEAERQEKARKTMAEIEAKNAVSRAKFEEEQSEKLKYTDSGVAFIQPDIAWLNKIPDLRIKVGGTGAILGVDQVLAGRRWIVGIVFGPDPSNREGFTSVASSDQTKRTSKGKSILAVQFASDNIFGPKSADVKFQVTLCTSNGEKKIDNFTAHVENGGIRVLHGEMPSEYLQACVAVVNEYFWRAHRKNQGVTKY